MVAVPAEHKAAEGQTFYVVRLYLLFCFIARVSPPRVRTYRVIVAQICRRTVNGNREGVRLIVVCFELLSF